MRKVLAYCASGLLLFGSASVTRTLAAPEPSWSFEQLQTTLVKLSIGNDLSSQEADQVSAISSAFGKIHAKYLQAYGPGSDQSGRLQEHLSREYIASLRADNSMLDNLPAAAVDRQQVLADVLKDLQLKADMAAGGLNAAAGFASVVRVTVTTQRAGNAVNGLWVRANPRRYGVTDQPLILFNSASSPTSAMLPPGYFTLWVESADKKVLASQPIAVGDGGRDQEQIVFALP